MGIQTALNNKANPATAAGGRRFLLAFLLLSITATMPLANAAIQAGGRDIGLSSSLGNLRGRGVPRNTEKRRRMANVDSSRRLQSEPKEEEFPNEVAIREDLAFRYNLVFVDTGEPQEEGSPSPFSAISVKIVYQGLAWIGFAIAGPDGEMVGSEAIIGIPEGGPPTNPGKYYLGGKSVDSVALMDDSQQSLIDANIQQDESSGVTTLTFTKLLAEPGELAINAVAGNTQNTFLWAIGSGNDLAYHGGGRGSFDLALDVNSASVTDEPMDSPTLDNIDEVTLPPTNGTVQVDASCYYYTGTRTSRQPGEWLAGPTIACMCDANGSGRWINCVDNNDGENADDKGDEDSSSSQPSSQPNWMPSDASSTGTSSSLSSQPSSTPSSLPSTDREDEGYEDDEEYGDNEKHGDDAEDEGSSNDGSAGASCYYNGYWRQPGEWLTGPTLTCMCDSSGSGRWINCRENDDSEEANNGVDEGDGSDKGSRNGNNYGY